MSDKKIRIEVDENDLMPEHIMPSNVMLIQGDAGEDILACVVNLSVESPQRVQDHLITVLDSIQGNCADTSFSGQVALFLWNDSIPDESCAIVEQVIDGTLKQVQAFADSSGFASADGNPLKFTYTFENKFPG